MKSKSGLPRLLWAIGSASTGGYSQRKVLYIHEMSKWFKNAPGLITGWEGSKKKHQTPLMDYLHQGVKHSQDHCQALLAFTVWAAAVSLSQLWHSCGGVHPSCEQPSFCSAQSKAGHPHSYFRPSCFGCVPGDNLTSSDFTWWKKWLQQLKHGSQKLQRI